MAGNLLVDTNNCRCRCAYDDRDIFPASLVQQLQGRSCAKRCIAMVHHKAKDIKLRAIKNERNGKSIVNITTEIAVKYYFLLFIAGREKRNQAYCQKQKCFFHGDSSLWPHRTANRQSPQSSSLICLFCAEKVAESGIRIKNKKPGVGGNTGFDPFKVQQ